MKRTKKTVFTAFILGLLTMFFTWTKWLGNVEALMEDHVYQKTEEVDHRIKLIMIDKKTTDVFGEPDTWSRNLYSSLITALYHEDCEPAVLAFYLPLFGEKDPAGDASFVNAVQTAGNVVVASRFETNTLTFGGGTKETLEHLSGISVPYGNLSLYTHIGFSNLLLDSDGYVRYFLPYIDDSFGYSNCFAMEILKTYAGASAPTIHLNEKNQGVFIDYSAVPNSYDTISYLDILTGAVDASELNDCIVIVGSVSDTYNVPIKYGTSMYGAEIQANILQSLMDDNIHTDVDRFLCGIVFGILIFLFIVLVLEMSTVVGSISYVFMLILFIIIDQAMFRWGQLLPVIYFPITLLFCYIYFLFLKAATERMQKATELQALLYSMAEAMTEAVDAKTPYNATHTRHVVRYCLELAEYVKRQNRKRKLGYKITQNDIEQLHMAALLHDVGKLDIPSKILDKSDRLGYRADALWEKWERIRLHLRIALAEGRITKEIYDQEIDFLVQSKAHILTLVKKEYLTDEDINYVQTLAQKKFTYDPSIEPIEYLNYDEMTTLSIRKGTLTKEELDITHFHVCYTEQILNVIRFGHNFNHVFDIARHHHEFLNGTGYPYKLKAEDIDIPTRILTICDIYDALTADDRPYKKAKSQEESFVILHSMADSGEIDKTLVTLAEELWLSKRTTSD